MPKTINDLLDLTLREVLENYCIIHNLECGYHYGIAPTDLIEKLFKNYNIEEDYPEAFNVENLITDEAVVDYSTPLLTYQKLEKIMRNLGITQKK